jgi:hypothetical protein
MAISILLLTTRSIFCSGCNAYTLRAYRQPIVAIQAAMATH